MPVVVTVHPVVLDWMVRFDKTEPAMKEIVAVPQEVANSVVPEGKVQGLEALALQALWVHEPSKTGVEPPGDGYWMYQVFD